MDFEEDDTGTTMETCETFDVDWYEVCIKAEETVHIKKETPEDISFPPIKTEPENSVDFLEGETDSCSGTSVTYNADSTEEVGIKDKEPVHVEDEIAERISFPPTKTEPEGTQDEQRHAQSAESGHSCDMQNGKRPYNCTVCEKAFSRQHHLISHRRTHSGERPYNCSVCNKAFSEKSNLTRHQLIHTGERSFRCAECDKAFRHKVGLIVHQRTHSGERPFICSFCSKKFIHQGQLNRHKLIHNDERPFNCAECDKTFKLKIHLIKHLHTHSG